MNAAMDETWYYETENITRASSLEVQLGDAENTALEQDFDENDEGFDLVQVEIGDEDFVLAVPEYSARQPNAAESLEETRSPTTSSNELEQTYRAENSVVLPASIPLLYYWLLVLKTFPLDKRGTIAS